MALFSDIPAQWQTGGGLALAEGISHGFEFLL
jgi:hypothetical protein